MLKTAQQKLVHSTRQARIAWPGNGAVHPALRVPNHLPQNLHIFHYSTITHTDTPSNICSKPSSMSSDSSSKRRNFRSSAWRKGSAGSNRRSSVEGAMHTADNSVSSYSSLPTGTLINHNRRSSTGTASALINSSSSKSADNLFETKPSSIPHDELKNQIEENLYLTQEVLDLKMRLANAMAQIDAEKHTNRLQAEEISHLYDDNDELKCYLDQAYERIAELEGGNNNNAQHHANANLCESASSTRPNEGWLHRVASTINMANNSTSSTNLCTDSQAQRKDAASPSNTVSTQSTMTLMERSTRRLSMLSLGSSLADEELPASFKDRRSSMYSFERRLSMYSSLSTFREEDKEEKGTTDDSDDDWLDEGVALPDDIEQVTFAARNA